MAPFFPRKHFVLVDHAFLVHRPLKVLLYLDKRSSLYKEIKESFCVYLSLTLITRLELPTLTLQLSNTINPLSANFKFIATSSHDVQFVLCSGLKTKKQSNIPLETTKHI